MKLHEKIKLMRTEKNWSQEQTAERLHMSLNAYGCIERGETNPNLKRLEQIAEIFGIELGKLVSDNSILNIGMDNSNFSHWYSGSSSEQLIELQAELKKSHVLLQEREKEVGYLKQEIAHLREIIALLKNNQRA